MKRILGLGLIAVILLWAVSPVRADPAQHQAYDPPSWTNLLAVERWLAAYYWAIPDVCVQEHFACLWQWADRWNPTPTPPSGGFL